MPLEPSQLGNWGALYDAILTAGLNIQSDKNTQFQFVSTPQVASWDSNTVQYYADYWGNNAPYSLGPTTTGPQIDVTDAYAEFINSLVLPVPSSPEYDRLKQQLKALLDQQSSVGQEAQGAYDVWKGKHAADFPDIKSFKDWQASAYTGGAEYQSKIDDLTQQIASVKAQLYPYESGINTAYTNAVAAIDPKNKVQITIPGSGDTKRIYDTRFEPSLGDFLGTVTGGGTVSPISVTLTSQRSSSDNWYVEGGATFDGVIDIIAFESEGGFTYDKQIESDSSFKAVLNVKGLQTFNIVREGNWLESNMLAEHMAGPFAGTSQNEEMFFGDKGALKLIPTQVLVAYGVTFSVTTSTSYYEQIKQTWEAEGGLMIGPFVIGGEAAGNSLTTTSSNDTTTVSLGSNDDHNAYVIGVSSMMFYTGS